MSTTASQRRGSAPSDREPDGDQAALRLVDAEAQAPGAPPNLQEASELVGRTVKSLHLLRWLIVHHEHHDAEPLGLAPEQLIEIREETERLIATLEPDHGLPRRKSV